MTRDEAERRLWRLMHSALAADSLMGHGFKPVRSLVMIRTTGKSVRQIVGEAAPLLRKAGMLKETPRSQTNK